MKILITGGAGFIGSYLTQELKQAHHNVIVYDAFRHFAKDGDYAKACKQRKSLLKNALIIRGDVRDKFLFRDVLEKEKPEVIIHLAAIATMNPREPFRDDIMNVNLLGSMNVIDEAAHADSVKRLILASSSMAYGDFAVIPQTENSSLHPINLYGASKAMSEIYLQSVFTQHNKEWIVIRPSAVYGAMDCNNRVIQIFLERAMDDQDLFVKKDEILDFTYVTDTAQGFFKAVTTNNFNDTYNITRGQGRKVSEAAEIIGSYFPQVKIKLQESVVTDKRPVRGELSIAKAREKLDYNPEYSLEDGIEAYITKETDMDTEKYE